MPTEVKGAVELRKALRAFTPDLAKETQQEIAAILKPITAKARGFVPSTAPLSGWAKSNNGTWGNRVWSSSEAKRGIGYKTTPSKPNRSGFRSLARIVNASPSGSIYETAGRKTLGHQGKSKNPEAGQKFIEELSKTGQLKSSDYQQRIGRSSMKFTGRAMFRAFAEDQGKATAAVQKALQKAQDNFYGKTK